MRNMKFRIVIIQGGIGEGSGMAGSPLVELIFSNILVLGLDGRFKGFHFWMNEWMNKNRNLCSNHIIKDTITCKILKVAKMCLESYLVFPHSFIDPFFFFLQIKV